MFTFVLSVVLINAFVLPWVCPRFVLKSPHIQEQMILINIPCTVFAMTFFPWNASSLTFKGVQTGHLSWSLTHHALLLCLGRAELLAESATSPS